MEKKYTGLKQMFHTMKVQKNLPKEKTLATTATSAEAGEPEYCA